MSPLEPEILCTPLADSLDLRHWRRHADPTPRTARRWPTCSIHCSHLRPRAWLHHRGEKARRAHDASQKQLYIIGFREEWRATL